MTENERLYEFLKEAADRGLITTSFDTSEQDNRTINRGASLGFLKPHPTQIGTYHLDDKGWKVVDANGDFSVVDEQPTSVNVNVTATNAHVGDNSGNYVQNNDSNRHKDNKMMRNAIIAIVTSTIAGLIVWLLTS